MENKSLSSKPATSRTPHLGSLSFRAKLIIGNMVIIALAIVGTGYYVYSRTNIAKNVLQDAQDKLNTTGATQAEDLNSFFVQMRKDISTVGTTTSNLLTQESSLNNTAFWDATLALSRSPKTQSWENPTTEPSSVFIPAKNDLTPDLAAELDTIKQLDLSVPQLLTQNPDTVAIYFGGLAGETLYYPNVNLAEIVPPDFDVTTRQWFVKASPAQDPGKVAVWSDPYLDAASNGLVVTTSIPVYDSGGSFRGVAAMDIQLNRITGLVSNIRIGKTGYAILVDKDKRLIALPSAGYTDLGITPATVPLGDVLDPAKQTAIPATLFDVLNNTASGKSGNTTITIGGVKRLVTYDPIPEVGYGLVLIAPSNELLASAITAEQQNAQEVRNTYLNSVLLVFVILIGAILATLLISNGLTSPLLTLTKAAEEISTGNLDTEINVRGQDEVGTLAKALSTMTASLRKMIQSLEQQVADRTTDLVRKTLYLQSAALVAHDAAEVQEINTLLSRTVEMISGRFNFYHVGIFLLDESGGRAVLQAASSEGGQRMLARGHSLEVGLQGIVGAAAYQNRPRVVMDVDTDKDYYKNPDLASTRSEAAIPLNAHGKVLGILDIQSTEAGAFRQDDIEVLQTMADQIGLAIQNAQSTAEIQSAIRRMETASAENVLRTWQERVKSSTYAYRYASVGQAVNPEAVQTVPSMKNDINRLKVPITLRGQRIGIITLYRKKETAWSETDESLAVEVSNQVGLALENARLLDDAQRRAAQEQSLSQLTAHLSSSLDPDVILQTAVRELYHLPNVEEVTVFLSPQETASSPEEPKTEE